MHQKSKLGGDALIFKEKIIKKEETKKYIQKQEFRPAHTQL